MTKYQPLSRRLADHPEAQWRVTFEEIETVLGFALPKAARSGANWWANEPEKAHSRAWVEAGWQVTEVNRATGEVTFRRPVTAAGLGAPSEVQPPAMKRAAEVLSLRSHARGWGMTAAVAAGAAVVAGVATLVVRGLARRGRD